MARGRSHRKIRKKNFSGGEHKIIIFTLLIGLAIVLGFLTSKFVIGPIIGYNANESPIQFADTEDDEDKEAVKEDDQDKEPTNADTETAGSLPSEGYALQFGAFSTQSAAKEFADALGEKGIEVEIVQIDHIYKVMGPILASKEEAIKALEEIKERELTDVFIASL